MCVAVCNWLQCDKHRWVLQTQWTEWWYYVELSVHSSVKCKVCSVKSKVALCTKQCSMLSRVQCWVRKAVIRFARSLALPRWGGGEAGQGREKGGEMSPPPPPSSLSSPASLSLWAWEATSRCVSHDRVCFTSRWVGLSPCQMLPIHEVRNGVSFWGNLKCVHLMGSVLVHQKFELARRDPPFSSLRSLITSYE